MKILLIAIGTQGDMQPFVAVGKGLKARGHEVTVCTHDCFESFVRRHDLECFPISSDLQAFMRTPEGRYLMENATNLLKTAASAIKVYPALKKLNQALVDQTGEAAMHVRPDAIVFHAKAPGTSSFAEKLGIPCMLYSFQPMFVPTATSPAMLFPNLGGAAYNRMTYRLVQKLSRKGTRSYVENWRKGHGLLPSKAPLLKMQDGTQIPVLNGWSEALLPQPHDWPEWATVAGFPFLEEPAVYQPSKALAAFLEAGAPPVYAGFGSIFGSDPAKTTRVVLEAIQKTGSRAILSCGWGGLQKEIARGAKGVFVLDEFVPHTWLFERVSMVIHHGGVGTTSEGLRAGKPTIICPFFGDQPYWDERHGQGAGPGPIP
ncbi:MAG: glycosyltransferase [Bdellovibrionota bacterium]